MRTPVLNDPPPAGTVERPSPPRGRRIVLLIVAGFCLLGALACAAIEFRVVGNRGTDFNQYRAAASLAGTGRLYDFASIRALELETHDRVVPFGRLPFFAVVFKPIALLPWGWGRLLWWTINVLAVAGFALTWRTRPFFHPAAYFWSCPLWMLLNYGQDTALFLFFASAGVWLLARKRDFEAGLLLSLCAAKFHLALAIPVYLAANRRWRGLAGGVAGGVAILAVSFAAEGPAWPRQLIELSRHPEFDPASWRMPNLAGLVRATPFPLALEVALALAAIVAVWRISRRGSLETGMMAALAAGLLVSHHAQAYDCVLLLPAIFSVLALPAPVLLRLPALALLTPIPYLGLLDEGNSVFARLLVVGFPLLVLGRLALTGSRRQGTANEAGAAGA